MRDVRVFLRRTDQVLTERVRFLRFKCKVMDIGFSITTYRDNYVSNFITRGGLNPLLTAARPNVAASTASQTSVSAT